jgi:LPXTG-motif cell wall-anchored protein
MDTKECTKDNAKGFLINRFLINCKYFTMKNTIIRLALAVVLMLNIAAMAMAQQPKATKDTINADKAAKPVFYQAAEEETSKGGVPAYYYIAGGIIVVAGAIFLLRKKKK